MSVPKYTKSDEERLAREIAADDDFYDEYSMGWDAGERIEQVEDAHLAIGHSLCIALCRRLSGRRNADSTPERQQALPASVADLIVMERAADATIASS